jgi:hypothetical protein
MLHRAICSRRCLDDGAPFGQFGRLFGWLVRQRWIYVLINLLQITPKNANKIREDVLKVVPCLRGYFVKLATPSVCLLIAHLISSYLMVDRQSKTVTDTELPPVLDQRANDNALEFAYTE